MLADSAAGAGDTGAGQGNDVQSGEQGAGSGEQGAIPGSARPATEGAAAADNTRLVQVLEAMGEPVPEELKPGGKNGSKGQSSEGAGQEGGDEVQSSDRASEGVRGRGGEAGAKDGAEDDEAALDDETRRQLPGSVIKMLDKRRHQRNEAREETKREAAARVAAEKKAAELEQQLKSTRAIRLNPTEQEPLADVIDEKELRQGVALHEELKDFTTLYPHGVVIVKRGNNLVPIPKDAQGNLTSEPEEGDVLATGRDGKPMDYSAQAIAHKRLEAERYLRSAPARAQFLMVKAEADNTARGLYPELFEEGTPAANIAADLVKQNPSLLKNPDGMLWVGRALTGLVIELERARVEQNGADKNGAAKNGNGAQTPAQRLRMPQPKIAPSTPQPRGGGGGGATGAKGLKEAEERAKQNPNDDNAIGDFIGGLRAAQSREAAAPV